jgi:hypothetical protein
VTFITVCLAQVTDVFPLYRHDDSNVKNFVDENEDLSTIPARKEYEKEAPVIPTVKTKKGNFVKYCFARQLRRVSG